MCDKICKFDAEFKVGSEKRLIKFSIYHIIDEMIYSAFDNWLARTEEYTSRSFVNYINSKNHPCISAWTESQFNKLLKNYGK